MRTEDFHDRRGTFSLAFPGQEETGRWGAQEPDPKARREVRDYYRGQKDSATWGEANRLAQRRTAHAARKHGVTSAADYASTYQNHLIRVMTAKGRAIQQQVGELKHPQDGYGRV
jgi:hypothetical protein